MAIDGPEQSPREAMECDVVVVGAGPAGLATAIRLKQLAAGAVPDDAPLDPLAEIWRAWQANKMDRGQGGLYRAVYTYGYGYVIVTPGRPYPVIRPRSPRQMIAMYADGADYPELALEQRRNGFRLIDGTAVQDAIEDSDAMLSWDTDGVVRNAERLADEIPLSTKELETLIDSVATLPDAPSVDPLIRATLAGISVRT